MTSYVYKQYHSISQYYSIVLVNTSSRVTNKVQGPVHPLYRYIVYRSRPLTNKIEGRGVDDSVNCDRCSSNQVG